VSAAQGPEAMVIEGTKGMTVTRTGMAVTRGEKGIETVVETEAETAESTGEAAVEVAGEDETRLFTYILIV
jgi:hypothetical protein